MTLTVEQEKAIAEQVVADWGTRDFWIGKCRYCGLGIDLVMAELKVTRSEAIVLWAAMLNDNAANSMRIAMHEYGDIQKRSQPLVKKWIEIAEAEMRNDDKPWEKS